MSHVSGKIEKRVTKKLSKEIGRTESRILSALSMLDGFLLNPQVRNFSLAVPRTCRNSGSENREPTGDRFAGNSCPAVVFSTYHSSNINDSEQEETHHIVSRVQEEIPYCSRGTWSEKQKKARSTSQPQIRSENTPATIEADQILLAPQHLATNSNSAKFSKNINRISKLAKSLKSTLPTFDGKSEKIKLFQDLFQTSLKVHKQHTEQDRINYFHSLMRGDALETSKNTTSSNRESLGQILTVFRRKNVNSFNKTQISTADLQSSEPERNWFSRPTPDAFRVAAQAILE